MIDFGLWAECESEESLQQLGSHFHNLEYSLLTGRKIHFSAAIINEEARGLEVIAREICEHGKGIGTLQETLEATETGIFLYHKLLDAPDFRFAHVGFDAYKTTSHFLFESVYTMNNGERWVAAECVVSEQLYNQLGAPRSLRDFRRGYKWRWYKGETYSPLFSEDQEALIELNKKMLPYDLEPNSVWW